MTKEVEIDLTVDDIVGGCKRNCRFCPIALAAGRREWFTLTGWTDIPEGGHQEIWVEPTHLNVTLKSAFNQTQYHKFRLPAEVGNWIYDFDQGRLSKCMPMKFIATHTAL